MAGNSWFAQRKVALMNSQGSHKYDTPHFKSLWKDMKQLEMMAMGDEISI